MIIHTPQIPSWSISFSIHMIAPYIADPQRLGCLGQNTPKLVPLKLVSLFCDKVFGLSMDIRYTWARC